jgi:hypothetical protein
MWQKISQWLRSVWTRLNDKTNLVIFVITIIVTYSPTWLLGPIGFLISSPYLVAIAVGYALFWAGPWTPYWPMVIAITFFVRKLYDKFRRK